MTLLQFLWALLITVIASLVVGVTGFGFGLVGTPLYASLMSMSAAVLIVTITSLPLMVQNAISVKTAIPWRDILPILVTSLPASVVGTIILARANTKLLEIILAGTTLLGCLVAVWVPKRALIHRTFPWAYLAGLLGGFIGGATGAGGPPVVLYLLLRGWDKNRTKVILSVYFACTTTWRLLQLFLNGLTPWPIVRTALVLIVPAMLMCYMGSLIFRKMSTTVFRYATIALLVAMAINLVV